MVLSLTHSTPSGSPLITIEDLKRIFPRVFDLKENGAGLDRVNGQITEWFATEREGVVDFDILPRVIGRTYWLKHDEQVDGGRVKNYLRTSMNGSFGKPVPLSQLPELISHAVDTLVPERKRKKNSHLTYIDLQARFPHLFKIDSIGRVKFSTRHTAVDGWFKTMEDALVDPAALRKIIGRAFYLKHRKPINPRHINNHLNGSANQPVRLSELGRIVSTAVAELIKGPTERPERMPDDVVPERPVRMVRSIFRPDNRLKKYKDHRLFIDHKSPEYITQVARGLITPLKGTAADSAKGTEEQICKKVYDMMHGKHEVEDDFLRACITAAWDQLSAQGSRYEGNKKSSKSSSGGKPLNIRPR